MADFIYRRKDWADNRAARFWKKYTGRRTNMTAVVQLARMLRSVARQAANEGAKDYADYLAECEAHEALIERQQRLMDSVGHDDDKQPVQ
jgi:hypothetical protein